MEDNRSSVIEKNRRGNLGDGELPPELEDCIKGATERCPVQVIHAPSGWPSMVLLQYWS
jgi:ferredoxin